ncbi:5-dehydro-2-deoxygluconokinase [Caproiciproducens sp. CPB-2]|uniref:5-dehydro-2-deoxygluconokinase n=1 Tax=Caproiciproducens sp. CPB-2 TaxID=3030017 RepID=UPI0023DC26EE|nr:5-dehydro-2-deoxygluconokinase [Caproiciproducens sp. CPB-2]MDF1494948.1 5-dehydro-2-deoxygluconokinase [Caproiciproducens sp. CPB-2]
MKYIEFDANRKFDLTPLGRITIDLNPVDYYKTLAESTTYRKYLGGSPANIAVGLSRLGKKCGFFARVSDDRFGDYVTDYFKKEGIDTSRIRRCENGEKLGLTFTEILSEKESSILMYRNKIADLQLNVNDIDEEYIKQSKALLISGTALAESPSREAALKALFLAKKTDTPVIFDIDYRAYNWQSEDELGVYYGIAAGQADVILGSREEYDLTQSLIRPGLSDGETAALWHSRCAKIVVIKHGKEGSTAYTCDGQSYTVKPFPIKKLKGFGGGDGYASAFLYGLLEGWEIIDCLEFGSASASLLVASHSCADSMPDVKTVRDYIADCKQKYGEMIARA